MTTWLARSARCLLLATLVLPVGLAAQQAPGEVAVFEGKGSLTIRWTMIRDKVTYRVTRAPDERSPAQDLTRPLPMDATSFVDATAVPGRMYFYQVIAVYGDGTEAPSKPVQYLPPASVQPTSLTPLPGGTLRGRVPPPPAPTGVVVTGRQASANVVWTPMTGVASFVVARKEANAPVVQAKLAANQSGWYDIGLRPSTAYTYMVDAIYPDGREAYTEVPFTTPAATNPWPASFKATQTGVGKVQLTWAAVNGASYYVLLGPGSSYGGVKVTGTSYTSTGVPPGNQTWAVGSYYEPGPMLASAPVGPNAVSTPATAFPTVALNVSAPTATPVSTARRTAFDPVKNGFQFKNDFKNSFIGPPINYTTSGLCGGMSYAVLDYFNAGRQVPGQKFRPANNTTLQQYLYGRQVTTLLPNLDKWAETTVNPFGQRTLEFFNWGLSGRLTELKSFIDRGVPVPLGLKGAGGGIDHDHQVLAIGYDPGRYQGDLGNYKTDLKIFIVDPNWPGETVTLIPNPAKMEYYEVEHPTNHWTTYFVDGKYTPQTPPAIVDPVYPNDGLVHELRFEINTGADDMRGGADHVDVTVKLTNNTSQYYPNISQNGIWLAWYSETAQVILSQPVPAAMIKSVEITTNATGGLNGDNWDLQSIWVKMIGAGSANYLVNRPSGPYRFTGAKIPFVITTP